MGANETDGDGVLTVGASDGEGVTIVDATVGGAVWACGAVGASMMIWLFPEEH